MMGHGMTGIVGGGILAWAQSSVAMGLF